MAHETTANTKVATGLTTEMNVHINSSKFHWTLLVNLLHENTQILWI